MIADYVLERLLDRAFEFVKKSLSAQDCKLLVSRDDIQSALGYHLKSVKNWAGEISFYELKKAKRLSDVFINLDVFVFPRRLKAEAPIESIPLDEMFSHTENHLVLVGLPGAGKTTSMKHLCQLVLFQEDYFPDRFSVPVLIKFRDLNKGSVTKNGPVINKIFQILGLKLQIPDHLAGDESASLRKIQREQTVVAFLEELKILLVLDGFDELIGAESRESCLEDIRLLAEHLDRATMVVTSRTGDFFYQVEGAAQFEICPLEMDQISNFAQKWLNKPDASNDFLEKIQHSPFRDSTIRPLTLAHLCAIYEREGKIPDKPRTVYRKIVSLLLEEWDQQRSVKRPSRYAKFEVDRKLEFLCHLAYVLTVNLQKTAFTKHSLATIYDRIHKDYSLLANEVTSVVSEIESHTGLFIQSGYDDFEFAHKSLQEYLTAEYIVKLPSIPRDLKVLLKIPNELAIATTISSKPSEYFCELILDRVVSVNTPDVFIKSFITRLVLERPDFNSSPELGFALAVLFSNHFVKSGIIIKDPTFEELERLIMKVLLRASLAYLRHYYRTDHILAMPDGDNVHRMRRIRTTPYYNDSSLPGTLYVRNSLLN